MLLRKLVIVVLFFVYYAGCTSPKPAQVPTKAFLLEVPSEFLGEFEDTLHNFARDQEMRIKLNSIQGVEREITAFTLWNNEIQIIIYNPISANEFSAIFYRQRELNEVRQVETRLKVDARIIYISDIFVTQLNADHIIVSEPNI